MITDITVFGESFKFYSGQTTRGFWKSGEYWVVVEFDDLPGLHFRFCASRTGNSCGTRREIHYSNKAQGLKTGRLKNFPLEEGTRILARGPTKRMIAKAEKRDPERIPCVSPVVLESEYLEALEAKRETQKAQKGPEPVLRNRDHRFID